MPQISIYDEVSFPSYPQPLSHPDRLSTIARLRGLITPAPEHCRVLEIGCGAGGNLIPLADTLPDSHFVGIDLSEQQIAMAQEHATACGLPNIEFLQRDILTLGRELGPFDYILCHGVFSWTTDAVRQKILELCSAVLTRDGVAYINYNTYPGWHLQGMLRDMLRHHADRFTDPADKVREARRMIDFLLTSLSAPGSHSSTWLRSELDAIRQNSDQYLFHAYLNVANQPFYLQEVVERAATCGLKYLGDAEPAATWPDVLSPDYGKQLRDLLASSQTTSPFRSIAPHVASFEDVAREQYFDFVRFCLSRRSLFTRAAIPVRDAPDFGVVEALHASANLKSQPAPLGGPPGSVAFISRSGRSITTADPLLQHTLQRLTQEWPQSEPCSRIWAEMEPRVGRDESARFTSRERWRLDLIRCFAAELIELSTRSAACQKAIPDLPFATRFARRQAATQDFVTNLRHVAVPLSEFDRLVLQQLDGTHNEEAIFSAAQHAAPTAIVSAQSVRQSLTRLASKALLARR